MNIESFLRKDYIANLIKSGSRLDGRGFDEYRPLEIEKGYVGSKANGSAFVKLGDTKVLAGISVGVGEPYPDAPTSGVMTVNSEFRPMASPYFESGPPGDQSIELARVVDRGIRESGSIDTQKLFIEDGKVWIIFIDLHMLDDCGNLIDASGIAAMAALVNTQLPKYEDGKIIYGETSGKLPLTCTPLPCTSIKVGNNLIVDPTTDEEYAMNARLTVSTTDHINGMQKGGLGSFNDEEIMQAIENSFSQGERIRKLMLEE